MANMSASILRNIVASVFNIKATNIILSGEVEPSMVWQDTYCDGSMGSDGKNYQVFGFNPKSGFEQLNIVGTYQRSNYAHSGIIDEDGISLCNVENVTNYVFFLVIEEGHNRWSGSTQESWKHYTLYKAPDFKSHWAKIEANDLARWEQWLAE